MRLINTRTLAMHEFVGRSPPPYAILSHTWGREEVTFQDYHYPTTRERLLGFAKIRATCQQARREGLEYAWVDACCIDKTSSSELGEAINSMFRWYREASICYAYLEDITAEDAPRDSSNAVVGDGRIRGSHGSSGSGSGSGSTTATIGFGHSRWFTRGWTLQELIAPRTVDFYNQDWHKIGEKKTMSKALAQATGIDTFILEGTADLQQVSVGRRMSWAVNRETARPEDAAYSLMGLFDANLPLIYGEGATRAFIRLQEKILQQTDDHTIFAWRGTSEPESANERHGLFATSPNDFRNFLSEARPLDRSKMSALPSIPTDNLARIWGSKMPQDPIIKTNKGIQITSKIKDLRHPWATRDLLILLLNCCFNGDPTAAAGIYLKRQGENHYVRIRASELATVHPDSTHTVASIYGLGSVEEIQHHHYDDQWTTSTRILGEITEARKLGLEAAQVRENYKDAFHIPRRSFNLYGLLGSFSLDRIWTVDSQGLWRSFLFNKKDHAGDLVLRTHAKFKTALVFTSRNGKEHIFIFLGTRAAPDGSTTHHLNAMCLSADQAAALHSRFVRKGFLSMNPRFVPRTIDASTRERTLLVSNHKSKLRIRTRLTTLYGIPMQRLRISWASVFSDMARSSVKIPSVIVYLSVLLGWIYITASESDAHHRHLHHDSILRYLLIEVR
jgi:hypothetical protein